MRKLTNLAILGFICLVAILFHSKFKLSFMPVAHSATTKKAATPVAPPTTISPANMKMQATAVEPELPPEPGASGAFPALDPSIKVVNHEGYSYDPTGRRDPFQPFIDLNAPKQDTQNKKTETAVDAPTDSLNSYDLGQFRLLGILWQVSDPKAMVQTPTGKVFLVKNRTKIGRNNGFVATIREGEVVIVEPSPDGSSAQTIVMTLQE